MNALRAVPTPGDDPAAQQRDHVRRHDPRDGRGGEHVALAGHDLGDAHDLAAALRAKDMGKVTKR